MLDSSVIQRDARACMMDWPVTIRHYYDPDIPDFYHQVSAAFSRIDEVNLLMGGGLLDQYTLSVFFITPDLMPLPLNRDRVDLLMSDGVTWLQLEVKHTPDNYDPLSQFTEIGLGTPFS